MFTRVLKNFIVVLLKNIISTTTKNVSERFCVFVIKYIIKKSKKKNVQT